MQIANMLIVKYNPIPTFPANIHNHIKSAIKPHQNRPLLLILLCLFVLMNVFVLRAENKLNNTLNISQYVRNIPKSEYNGANQNWSVTQDNDGFIYVANRLGVLEFNGTTWTKHALKSSSQVRSLLAAKDGRVYYGQFEDFGYLERDKFGQLRQISISDSLVSAEKIKNQEIWNIIQIGDKLYFKSFGKVYIYYDNKIKVIEQHTTVYSLFEYKNKPCVQLFNEGLFYINKDDELEKVSFSKQLEQHRIIGLLSSRNKQEYVITEFNGIFIKKGNEFITWQTEANELLKDYQINKCKLIGDDLIAFGTIGNGLILVNHQGQILASYDKTNGLQSNTVLALLIDKNNNLWAGLNGGIDFLEVNSPNLYCFDKTGVLGTVHCSVIYKGELYLGTNQGLFCTQWKMGKSKNRISFSQIEEAQGQVWSLKIIDNKLFCNYNLGLLQIDAKQIRRIGNIGGYTVLQHPEKKNILYQATYNGVLIFRKNINGGWDQDKWLHTSQGEARYLNIDPYNNLWVAENRKNVKLLRMNIEGDSVLSSRYMIKENGFDPNKNVRIFDFENRVVFSNNDNLFTYDYISEVIKPYDWLNKELNEYSTSNFIANTDKNEFWLLQSEQFGQFFYHGDSLTLHNELHHDKIHYSIESDRLNIYKIEDNKYLLGLDNGFMIYSTKPNSGVSTMWKPTLKLVNANCYNEKGQITRLSITVHKEFEIPFQYRNLNLSFAIPGNFPQHQNLWYSLDNGQWINNGSSTALTFNYLKSGNHTLRVKVINDGGKSISEIAYNLNISLPWYLSHYMIAIYTLCCIGLIYLLGWVNRYRLKKQKLSYLKKIKSDNTKRIIRMKNQYLKTEIQNKSAQLVNYTVLLGKKNEVLIKIKELLKILPISHKDQLHKVKIYDIIEQNLSDKNDWKMFSAHFNEAHSNFLKKLKSTHEILTPADLQLCAYLKMNLSSKEIASLLNISPRSVEVKRYRLRQKLKLSHEENLVEYLLGF